MKQKHLSALLLALMVALTLSACGSKQHLFEEQTEHQAEASHFEAGMVEGNTYTNETLGVTLTLDENWTFLNDEQISALTATAQNMSGSEAETPESDISVFDVAAVSNDGSGRSINITMSDLSALDDLGASGSLYAKLLSDEETYVTLAIGQAEREAESLGAENVEVEATTYTLAGAEHSGVHIKADMQGVTVYESVTCINMDNLIYNITCVARSEEELTAVMEMFQAL